MQEPKRSERFEDIFLPYLDAAYSLARWLTNNDADAEDVVQEAYLRAYKFFDQFRGGDGRAWLLTIVRNTCFTWLQANRVHNLIDQTGDQDEPIAATASPEAQLIQNVDRELLEEALTALPPEFREALVLRELEGLSYKEIATVANISLGTVMSRLARARQKLQHYLECRMAKEKLNELPR